MLSPMVSALCLSIRVINIAKPTDENKNKTQRFMVFINMWFSFFAGLSTFIGILSCYEYYDTRPVWARQFDNVRFDAPSYY